MTSNVNVNVLTAQVVAAIVVSLLSWNPFISTHDYILKTENLLCKVITAKLQSYDSRCAGSTRHVNCVRILETPCSS
jgi:hypothetical protein